MNVVCIVEGKGDKDAFPTLIAKAGNIIGEALFSHNPIRAGTAHYLAREGALEKFVRMALGREGVELVLVAVDLDDGCPAEFHASFSERVAAMGNVHVPVRFVFCVREYEAWFLHNLAQLRQDAPEYGWLEEAVCEAPEAYRGAKERLSDAMKRGYRPSVHQLDLTRKLDLKALFAASRSFRKFVKNLAGVEYDLVGVYFA